MLARAGIAMLVTLIGGTAAPAQTDPRLITLEGTAATPGQSWRPRLQLFEHAEGRADRKRPVLYVHGATFSSENSVFFRFGGRSWADALNEKGLSVWGVDLAGYGRSEVYPDMKQAVPNDGEPLGRAAIASAQIERAVRAVIAETGAAKVSIVAHSWGTMAAGRFAGEHPELVDRLVLFGPVVQRRVLAGTQKLGPWRHLTVEEQKKRFVEDVPAGEPPILEQGDFPAWSALYLSLDETSASRAPPSVRTPNGPVADIMDAWSGNLAYEPGRIRAPTLIVRGEWDSLCRDGDVAWLRQALKGAPKVVDVKVPRATHLMHLETGRAALYAAANEFLTSN